MPVNFDPIAFRLGALNFTWYGILHAIGILLAWIWGRSFVEHTSFWRNENLRSRNYCRFDLWVLGVLVSTLVGARMGHVVIYNLSHYLIFPSEIFMPWLGGLSFHGGAVGALTFTLVYVRFVQISLAGACDVLVALATINVTLGRLGNFINGELWGRPTTVPWAMIFPRLDHVPRHPSQLYEMIAEGLLPLIVAMCLIKSGYLQIQGTIAGSLLIVYASSRMLCEHFREPEDWMGRSLPITAGQALSLPILFLGIAFLCMAITSKRRVTSTHSRSV